MKQGNNLTAEILEDLQRRERQALEVVTNPVKAAQIEGLLALQKWEALVPAFEAIEPPQIRLRAAAHASRMAGTPGLVAGSRLSLIAAKALSQYQRMLTPIGERAAVVLCIDLIRGSEILDTRYIEKVIVEHLISRLAPSRGRNSDTMNKAVKAQARHLLCAYFDNRQGNLVDRPLLVQLRHHARNGDVPTASPARPDAPSNVTYGAFDKPRAG